MTLFPRPFPPYSLNLTARRHTWSTRHLLWLNIGFSLHSGLRLLSHARVASQINRFIANIGTIESPKNVGALETVNKLAKADLNGISPCLVSHLSYLFLSACVSLCMHAYRKQPSTAFYRQLLFSLPRYVLELPTV